MSQRIPEPGTKFCAGAATTSYFCCPLFFIIKLALLQKVLTQVFGDILYELLWALGVSKA